MTGLDLGHTLSLELGHQHFWFSQAFGPGLRPLAPAWFSGLQAWTGIVSPAFLGLQLADVRSWGYELVDWTRARVLSQAKTPCLGQGGSFSARIRTANKETDAETGTAQSLFNSQKGRSRNLVHKSTSQPSSGGDTKYIRGSK